VCDSPGRRLLLLLLLLLLSPARAPQRGQLLDEHVPIAACIHVVRVAYCIVIVHGCAAN
jgi:hypothetical protein